MKLLCVGACVCTVYVICDTSSPSQQTSLEASDGLEHIIVDFLGNICT